MSTRRVAELLDVTQSTVYRMIDRGDIRGVKIGGKIVVLKRDLAHVLGVEPATCTATVKPVQSQ